MFLFPLISLSFIGKAEKSQRNARQQRGLDSLYGVKSNLSKISTMENNHLILINSFDLHPLQPRRQHLSPPQNICNLKGDNDDSDLASIILLLLIYVGTNLILHLLSLRMITKCKEQFYTLIIC